MRIVFQGSTGLTTTVGTPTRSSNPSTLVGISTTLYCTANSGVNGIQLWKSNGTEAGAVLVKDIDPDSSGATPLSLTSLNGNLFFSANDGIHGSEIWRSVYLDDAFSAARTRTT